MLSHKRFLIHTDGGARGNPGPGAIGVVISTEKGEILKEYGEYIGETTNNEAEYQAVIFALEKLKSLIGKKAAKKATLKILADSELLVRQLNGEYKVEDAHIQQLFLRLWNLRLDFGKVTFTAIPREENREADRLVNEALHNARRIQKLLS